MFNDFRTACAVSIRMHARAYGNVLRLRSALNDSVRGHTSGFGGNIHTPCVCLARARVASTQKFRSLPCHLRDHMFTSHDRRLYTHTHNSPAKRAWNM